ncbi:Hypothetical predicted protein [Lecanosticta acicola]|uniref:Uncharacterized protein n=1 Tax=Lecanosticta acicola TaxID=111012 RepID=A0AAI9EA32_9PEZI|nr:Hypothetical predicted protein [Lecanosticta acicola]
MNRGRRFFLLTIASVLVLIGPFLIGYHFSAIRDVSLQLYHGSPSIPSFSKTPDPLTRKIHLILPATGPTIDLCKLLLSGGILGYPEPIFIGWEGRGIFNGSQSHLFKITETLTYLRTLPREADTDMIVILDAYDIWLQLRPDVLLNRYYEVLRKNDLRLQKDGILGKQINGYKIESKIIIGPDKIYWPQGPEDPATWAVPQSPLPEDIFGPDTDTDAPTSRPRWLNSGTIMGPAKEMRDYFAATVDMVSKIYDSSWEFRTSDQYYFAEVWAEQEVMRRKLQAELKGQAFQPSLVPGTNETGIVPHIPAGKRTEYGILQDYNTDVFQTAAGFELWLTWMRFNGSTKPADLSRRRRSSSSTETRIDEMPLPAYVRDSAPPYAATRSSASANQSTWEQMLLGTNVIMKTVFPLFHMTGDKTLKYRWWPRMWFHPHAEALLTAGKRAREEQEDPDFIADMHGIRWMQARPDLGKMGRYEAGKDGKGGAWVDNGKYVRFANMCGSFEDYLYLRRSEAVDLHSEVDMEEEVEEEEGDEGDEG